MRAEVRSQLRNAERQLRRDPTGVSGRLENVLEAVEGTSGIDPELRGELALQLRSAIEVSNRREAQHIEDSANNSLPATAVAATPSPRSRTLLPMQLREAELSDDHGDANGQIPGETSAATSPLITSFDSRSVEEDEADLDEVQAMAMGNVNRNSLVDALRSAGRSGQSDAGVIGDAQIQFVPEKGNIIISGANHDVDRVIEVMEEIEEIAKTTDEVGREEQLLAMKGDGDDRRDREDLRREFEVARQQALKALDKGKPEKRATWKPATATTNRARLSIGHHDDLPLAARDTYVRIDGFRARVFFDLYYYNDRPQQLEGQFMLRLPSDAALHYFAFGPTPVATADEAPPATGKPGAQVQPLTPAQGAVRGAS